MTWSATNERLFIGKLYVRLLVHWFGLGTVVKLHRPSAIATTCCYKTNNVRRSDIDYTVLPANYTISAFTPSRRASLPFGRYSLRLPTEGWPG